MNKRRTTSYPVGTIAHLPNSTVDYKLVDVNDENSECWKPVSGKGSSCPARSQSKLVA